MRKQFLLTLILCLAASLTWAERIDVATARKVAESVARREGSTGGLRSAGDLPLVYAAAPGQSGSALRSGAMEGSADYFVFNFPGGKGFAIVAGDDRVRPVLGYSDEGSFDPDNLPENLRGWLAGYQEQITWAVNKGIEATPEISAEWSRLMSGTALRAAGEPVLLETAKWNQEEPYNNQTPVIGGKKTYTGCGATAAAIVMRYNEHPKTVVTNGVSSYNVRGVEYPVSYAPYQWEQMPLEYRSGYYTEEQANQVAALMWNIGANVQMDYDVIGTEGSSSNGTDIAEALRSVFGYSLEVRYVYKSDYRWEDWKDLIRNEIDQDRPMVYRGSGTGGHLFVLDGYNQEEAFHFNWGWGGSADGFYLLTALNPNGFDFSQGMGMIMGIKPAEAGDQPIYALTYLSLSSSLASLNGQTSFVVSAGFKNTGSNVFNGYMNIAKISENGQITPISTSKPVSELGVSYYYSSWSFDCTLSEPLNASDKIIPIYSLDDTNWKVMSGSADAPLYINQNGVVEEGDDPNDPTEQPFRMEIYYNSFESSYLAVSGLDNNEWHNNCIANVNYKAENAREGFVLRYTLKDYAAWKGHIHIYQGGDDLSNKGAGELVNIGDDGTWEVPIALSDFAKGNYIHRMKVLSDKAGDLPFEIAVYEQSDLENPVLESKDCAMRFIKEASAKIDPNPIIGSVGTKIPFSFTIDNVDPSLIGQRLSFYVNLRGLTQNQVKLSYKVDGNEQEVNLETSQSDPTQLYANFTMGQLTDGFRLEFVLESKAVTSENTWLYISPSLYYGNFPCSSNSVSVQIKSTPIVTHSVVYNLEHLSVPSYAPTLIEEGEELWINMEKESGYDYPNAIQVTMGGNILQPGYPDNGDYQYIPESGSIRIPSVTGDVVITATAIPADISFKISNFFDSKYLAVGEPIFDRIYFISSNPDLNYRFVFALADPSDAANLKIVYGNENSISNPKDLRFDAQGKATILSQDCRKDNANFIAYMKVTAQGEKASIPYSIQVYDETSTALYHEQESAFRITRPIRLSVDPIRGNLNKGNVPFTLNMTDAGSLAGQKANLSIRISNHDDVALALVYDGKTTAFVKQANNTYLATLADFPLAVQKYAFELIAKKTTAEDSYVPMVDFSLTDPEGNTLSVMGQSTATLELYYEYALKATLTKVDIDGSLPQGLKPGETLAVTLKPATNYKLPQNITVKMAGVTLEASRYTYNSSTGAIKLENVQGDVEIIANGVDDQHFEVTLQPTGVIFEPSSFDPILINEKLTVKLTAEEGYELPKSISVTMGGTALTIGEGYIYTIVNGSAILEIAKVTAPVIIIAKATPKSYTVDADGLKNLTSDIKPGVKVEHGKPFVFKLTAAPDFLLPAEITITAAGKPLTVGTDYTYDPTSGIVKINAVKGNLTITAKAEKIPTYQVKLTLAGITSDWDEAKVILEGGTFECKLTAKKGYKLPSDIAVTIAGVLSSNYSYDSTTGTIRIENIKGAIEIAAAGIDNMQVEVILLLADLTADRPNYSIAQIDGKLTVRLTANSGYELPSAVKVEMGDKTLVVNDGYIYDAQKGIITIEKVTGDVVITANGSRIPEPEPEPEPTPTTYTVTLPVVEGATIVATGSTTVSEGSSLSFTVEVKAGYNADKMVVKANGTTLTPDANGRYTIANILSNVVVTVTGIVKGDDPTANETIGSDELRVWGANGRLFIQTPVADTAYIVAFDGRVCKTLSLSAGEYTEAMPQGSYIIHIGKRSYKLNF